MARFLGPALVPPNLAADPVANLVIGALYFNTAYGRLRVYTAAGWVDATPGFATMTKYGVR